MQSKLLKLVGQRLDALGVKYSSVSLSDRPGKKIKLVVDGKTVHFGAKGSETYLEGSASEVKRAGYRARHEKIMLKTGQRAVDVELSPAWLSMNVLWS